MEAVDQVFGANKAAITRRLWKLSGFSGRLIMHTTKFTNILLTA
jgi:hypothetical protein